MEKTVERHALTLSGFLITLTGAVLFSTKAIIVKKAFANTSVDALTLLTLRMVFSLPFYLATAFFISRQTGNIKMTPVQWAFTFLIGLLGYYVSSFFDFLGLQYISAGLERLILFLYPTFAVLINTLVYKETINKNQKLALLLTYIGIGIAFFGELSMDGRKDHALLGSFLVFLCAITYAIYIVGSGRIIPQVGAAKFTAYAMLAATSGIFIHFFIRGEFIVLSSGTSLWGYGLMLGIIATVIPSFFLSYGMKQIGSNNVAIISSIGPVSTIIQASIFLGETIIPAQLFGTALVITGIILLGRKRAES